MIWTDTAGAPLHANVYVTAALMLFPRGASHAPDVEPSVVDRREQRVKRTEDMHMERHHL